MVLGKRLGENCILAQDELKSVVGDYVYRMGKELGSIDCSYLRLRYRTPESGCREVLLTAAKILDEIIQEKNKADDLQVYL